VQLLHVLVHADKAEQTPVCKGEHCVVLLGILEATQLEYKWREDAVFSAERRKVWACEETKQRFG
jgi:hypothetical protein